MLDPIHFVEASKGIAPGWYFWNEDRTARLGPFNNLVECELALSAYLREKNAVRQAPTAR